MEIPTIKTLLVSGSFGTLMYLLFEWGDLNNIMNAKEKLGPSLANFNRISAFCSLIKRCGLTDLSYNGLAFTWTNKRFAPSTFERHDRFLGNPEWIQNFLPTTVLSPAYDSQWSYSYSGHHESQEPPYEKTFSLWKLVDYVTWLSAYNPNQLAEIQKPKFPS